MHPMAYRKILEQGEPSPGGIQHVALPSPFPLSTLWVTALGETPRPVRWGAGTPGGTSVSFSSRGRPSLDCEKRLYPSEISPLGFFPLLRHGSAHAEYTQSLFRMTALHIIAVRDRSSRTFPAGA